MIDDAIRDAERELDRRKQALGFAHFLTLVRRERKIDMSRGEADTFNAGVAAAEQAALEAWDALEALMAKKREQGPQRRSCNRHSDCDAAEAKRVEAGKAPNPIGFHCWSEDCEDCFGK